MSTFFLVVFFITVILAIFLSFQFYYSLKIAKRWIRLAFVGLNILAATIFTVRMVFDYAIEQRFLALFGNIGYTWLFIAAYSALFFVIYLCVLYADKIFDFIPAKFKLQSGVMRFRGFIVYLVVISALIVVGKYNFRSIKIINLEKSAQTELSQDYRVVFISDVHIGDQINLNDLERFTDKINSLNPDIVLIGGDLFDKRVKQLYDDGVGAKLGAISSKYGVYYIFGNHDYFGRRSDIIEKIATEANLIILKDSIVAINDELLLLGRDDQYQERSTGRKSISSIVEGVDLEAFPFKIAVEHQPTTLDEAVDLGFDYLFAGHTHNGQLFPFNLLVKLQYKYTYGHYKPTDKSDIFISSGLGIWGPLFRIGSRSEIIVLDVK
ncbi:MAG: metallophosphoesterase [Rikenellaceae bacterium]